MRKITLLFIVLLITATPVFAQSDDVDVDIPDIPAGQQVTITYRARVNSTLPVGLQFISDQGRITVNGETLLTTDPRVAGNNNPTRTAVGISATALPATGETPWWRTIIFIGGVALVIAGAITLLMGRNVLAGK